MSKLLAVVGFHRSGTSATAGALARLGVHFGPPGRLMAATQANPRGYYENVQLVAAHEGALARLAYRWDTAQPLPRACIDDATQGVLVGQLGQALSVFNPQAPVWGAKDPRMCRFPDAWIQAAQNRGRELHACIVLREPTAACASLAQREGWSPEQAHDLLLAYHAGVTEWATRVPSTVVFYEELLEDWPKALGPTLAAVHGTQGDLAAAVMAGTREVDAFLSKELNHWNV